MTDKTKDEDCCKTPRAKMMEKMSKRTQKGRGCCDANMMSQMMEMCCGSDEEAAEVVEEQSNKSVQEA